MDWPAKEIEMRDIGGLIPYARNARTHSAEQIAQLAASITEWGWTMPVLVDEAGMIIAGHGRIAAAETLGIKEVPVMVAAGWSDEKKRAYVLADNKLALNAAWDDELLRLELGELKELGADLKVVGFTKDELEKLFYTEGAGAETGINYEEQYAVLVVCADASEQEGVYDKLKSEGYECKILVT